MRTLLPFWDISSPAPVKLRRVAGLEEVKILKFVHFTAIGPAQVTAIGALTISDYTEIRLEDGFDQSSTTKRTRK